MEFLFKRKLDLAGIMLGLIENLKNNHNMQVQYLCCDNTGKNVAVKKSANKKGRGWTLNILPQVCPNKMVMLKNMPLSSTK